MSVGTRAALIGCVALALFAAPAVAAPMTTPGPYLPGGFGAPFTSEVSPNVINLWTDKAGGFNGFGAGTLPSGWSYYQNDVTSNFAQLYTTAPAGAPNFTWTQFFHGANVGVWSFDWQEVNYNWTTGTIVGGLSGNLLSTNGAWSSQGYQNVVGQGNALVGPVPEPGTFLLVGLGAAALLYVARRRAAAQLVPVAAPAPAPSP